MRYGIVEHHENGREATHPYFVVDSQQPTIERGMLGPKFSKAEASVIAWAFTAIENGFNLCALDAADLARLRLEGVTVTRYDGPTTGLH